MLHLIFATIAATPTPDLLVGAAILAAGVAVAAVFWWVMTEAGA